ncbi:hypothetical protein [Heyndrickxia oleronia]|jgi:hypothetical protein|uniref:hypothetical protein n=1 Tax=Heyndrickxia oleronia TaxID=38875 RepID=UPI00242AB840|nr:hypothetical protein [Heyndrickxia oleronia]MCI1589568.1 hypothetical protein [Heyndrickxia oleronia]MCI1611378.1 hypothetical protein [Heyndrickxia oleronia]MCI1742820.1 hypothetical protein [Heyndrickxia oleronia]MCI1759899.1 hypothetical protein [Heyndrickxia oleronia]
MGATLWGNLDLIVKVNNGEVIATDWLIENEALHVNGNILSEQDIWVEQLDENTYQVNAAVTFIPNAQTEDEAFKEAINKFSKIDIDKYYIEDTLNNLTETTIQIATVHFSDFENPSIGVYI